jgi:hypothetical protein
MRKYLLTFSLAAGLSASAQETDYTKVIFSHKVGPTMTQYNDYKTFDVTVLTTKEETDKPGTGFNLPYKLKIGELSQVETGGDFHIITLVQRYGGKMTGTSTAVVNIGANTTVYNKYGNVVKTASFVRDEYPISFGRELTKEESGNQDVTRRLIMEKVLDESLRSLKEGLFGTTLQPIVRLASLDDVKKLPELKQFEEQVKILKPVLEKGGLSAFMTGAETYIPFWEGKINYSGDNAEDVKRAALHNLALYYIAANNPEKAKNYIEQYKPIDKQIKEMMGLVKYKNSEELEKLLTELNPVAPAPEPQVAAGEIKTTAQVIDAYRFLLIDGTVTIKTKKQAGTYEGVIKVNKIPSGSFGNVVNLDPENIAVAIQTKDASGNPLTINTTIAQIEQLKAKTGETYTTEKFGTAMLGDGSYNAFMVSTFTSPKVTVYRTILPAGNSDYVVRKTGDQKGVKSSLFNARKNLEEYFSDCTTLVENFKNGSIEKNATAEKIAEVYSDCK